MCRDRLADAIARFGRVPIHRRTLTVTPDHPAFRRQEQGPQWAAGGLVHDPRRRVLLIRHVASSGWGSSWLTPGGWLEEGERVDDGLRREIWEEVGLEIDRAVLTRILNDTITDGARVCHAYFAQFVAAARSAQVREGPAIAEARWFARLPEAMAFRADYVGDFQGLIAGRF